jgi:predicted benzoate:H+ symporter BenE
LGHNRDMSTYAELLGACTVVLVFAAFYNIRSRRSRPEAKRWWIAANVLTVPGLVLLMLFGKIYNLWLVFPGIALLIAAGICRLTYDAKLRRLGLPRREPTITPPRL